MNPVISIIIPVYDVSAYIERCVDSVIAQTYAEIECLFVNDCTPDNSVALLEERIKKYRGTIDFKILHHEQNRGLSAARNTGIDAASGDYVYFLDSDDELFNNTAIAGLVEVVDNYDVVVGGVVTGDGKDYCKNKDLTLKGKDVIMDSYFKRKIYTMAWNKLVNTRFLLNNRLYFKEGLIREDELRTFQLVTCANSIRVVDLPSYIYHIRANTLSTNFTLKNIEHLLYSYTFMQEQVKDNYSNSPLAVSHLLRFIFRRAVSAIQVCKCSYSDYKRLIKFDRSLNCHFLKLENKHKMKYLFFLLPVKLQYLLLKIGYFFRTA
jgi:glycosyltransferase involved in cell wall biosynthesis